MDPKRKTTTSRSSVWCSIQMLEKPVSECLEACRAPEMLRQCLGRAAAIQDYEVDAPDEGSRSVPGPKGRPPTTGRAPDGGT